MKKTLVSILILLGVCLLFFWPLFKGFVPFPGDLLINQNPYRSLSVAGFGPGAYPNKAQGMDVITEMYPWRHFTISELKQGKIPFWNPYNFSGNILMQNLQSSVFNPFNLLFFLLPFNAGWSLFILMQPLLASFFFYLFAKDLKVSRFAAILGAIAFAFSQYMTVWIEYGNIAATLAYLPLLLFFLHRFLNKENSKSYIGFIVSAVLMLLSGYIQGAFYSYIVAFFFTVWFFVSEKKMPSIKTIATLCAMFFFPALLTLFQFLPTVQIFSQSTRWPYSIEQIQNLLQPPWYWVTLFASDFFGNPATRNYYLPITYIERVAYIGVPTIFFAIAAFSKKRRFTFFFAFLAILVVLLTTNLPGVAYFYKLPIPVINTTVPTRALSIFMFAGVMLATFGIDYFYKVKKIPWKLMSVFTVLYILLWVGLFVVGKIYPQFAQQITISKHNLILPTMLIFGVIVVIFLAKRFSKLSMMLLGLIIVLDLFYNFQKITPFAPNATIYPKNPVTAFLQTNAGINRFWGYGSGYIAPNFQTVEKIYSPEGNDPLHSKNYGDLLTSSYDGKAPLLPPRPDANLAKGFGESGMKNTFRQTLLNLLGVKYIVQHDESRKDGDPDTATFPKETYSLIFSQNPWQIYENTSVLPRYFLVNSFVVAQGQEALNKLYTIDLSKTIVLEKNPHITLSPKTKGSVALKLYSPQKIIFTTNTTGSMILFLSDTYYPSWKATIDGSATEIFLADYTFRALIVPAGKHTVTMYFESTVFNTGILIAGVSFVLFLLSVWLVKKYENKK